jgi:hypothetical protein
MLGEVVATVHLVVLDLAAEHAFVCPNKLPVAFQEYKGCNP